VLHCCRASQAPRLCMNKAIPRCSCPSNPGAGGLFSRGRHAALVGGMGACLAGGGGRTGRPGPQANQTLRLGCTAWRSCQGPGPLRGLQ